MTAGPAPGDRPDTAPRKRRLGRPPTLDRDAALIAARDVIARRGFDRTRYADVAEAAKVPVTTLQHAFGSLQGLLLESVQRSTASEIAVLRDTSSQDPDSSPWDRLSAFVHDAVQSDEDYDTWPVWVDLWRLASRDAEIGARAGVVYAQWWNYAAELIELGTDAGQFTSALAVERPYEAAQAIVGMVDGLAAALVMRADGQDHATVRRIALDAAATLLGYDAPDRVPALAISVEQAAGNDEIIVDGPVPPAEPLSAEGPLPGPLTGAEAPTSSD